MNIRDIFSRSTPLSGELPKFHTHITESIVSFLDEMKLLMVFELQGIPFQLISDDELEVRYNTINEVYLTLTRSHAPRVALWQYVIRRRTRVTEEERYINGRSSFSKSFTEKYLKRFSEEEYFENSFFIAVVLKYDELSEGVDEMQDISRTLHKTLFNYKPKLLSTYEEDSTLFSETYEFLSSVISVLPSGDVRVPLSDVPACEIIPNADLAFGYDLFEARTDNTTKFGCCFDLRGFPETSKAGLFNVALSETSEFILSQSFQPITTTDAMGRLSKQLGRLGAAEDQATDQLRELHEAHGDIQAGRIAIGEYHGALIVLGASQETALNRSAKVVSAFNTRGVSWVKATHSAPITFLSQLPGAKLKPRPTLKSSRVMGAAFSMETFGGGKMTGNPIGDGLSVMPLQTDSKTVYHLNFHPSKPDEVAIGEKVAGHLLILGSTGSGKTTLQLCGLTFFDRFDGKLFALDKDRGMEIFLRALGGTYVPLRAGEPTGLAPFQLEPTPQNKDFLYSLVESCAGENEKTRDAQIKTDAAHKKQVQRVADITKSDVTQWTPNPRHGKDLAEVNARLVEGLKRKVLEREGPSLGR